MTSVKQAKLCTLSIIFLLAMTAIALPAAAQEGYVSLGENAEGAWSFHRSSVEERRNDLYRTTYIAGWVQVVYSDAAARNISYLHPPYRGVFFYAANKELKQVQILSESYYSREGVEIESDNWSFIPSRWKECPPGSTNETIWNALMQAAGYR